VIFTPLRLEGAYLIHMDPISDDRGFNARLFCQREFGAQGLMTDPVQVNIIGNHRRGTLRGMHYQADPHGDAKLFRINRGAIFDVIVDTRPKSPTFAQWQSVELRAGDHQMLYVPAGFGQGFQTLEDDTELTYLVSEFHAPQYGRGFRHDDPAFGIEWPLDVTVMTDKDRSWPDYEESQ
jgi:dTDP-4-dehydrorhamnose 3,5-epimerase